MTPLTRIKLLVAATGLCVWGVGVRLGEERLKWGGIALLAISVLLRLFREEPPSSPAEDEDGDGTPG